MTKWQQQINAVIREIKRRRMIHTCVLYAVLCWGMLKATNILLPSLGSGTPDAPRLLVYGAVIGLPAIIAFAWFYQFTSSGIVRTDTFTERRLLANIKPIDDRRHGLSDGETQQYNTKNYDWVIFAQSGPLEGLSYPVTEPILIGRAIDCDLAIMSPQMSRHHAQIEIQDGVLSIEDLESANGTQVNGTLIKGKQLLNHGDVVQFQNIEFLVKESLNRARSADSSMNQTTLVRAPGGAE